MISRARMVGETTSLTKPASIPLRRSSEGRMNRLQAQHKRQSAIPEAFAMSTLAASTRPVRTEAQRKQHTRDARKVARLISRGELRLISRSELEAAIARPIEVDIETAFSEAVR